MCSRNARLVPSATLKAQILFSAAAWRWVRVKDPAAVVGQDCPRWALRLHGTQLPRTYPSSVLTDTSGRRSSCLSQLGDGGSGFSRSSRWPLCLWSSSETRYPLCHGALCRSDRWEMSTAAVRWMVTVSIKTCLFSNVELTGVPVFSFIHFVITGSYSCSCE